MMFLLLSPAIAAFAQPNDKEAVKNVLNNYKKEIEIFYGSTKTDVLEKSAVKEGLSFMKQRQHTYFKGRYENLHEIDNFFLTMEGLGQYSMFLWLKHPKGGNIKREIAIEGVRRGGKWWSQDEGFALFLIFLINAIPSAKFPVSIDASAFHSKTSLYLIIGKSKFPSAHGKPAGFEARPLEFGEIIFFLGSK